MIHTHIYNSYMVQHLHIHDRVHTYMSRQTRRLTGWSCNVGSKTTSSRLLNTVKYDTLLSVRVMRVSLAEMYCQRGHLITENDPPPYI
jgi:hypothetical protein